MTAAENQLIALLPHKDRVRLLAVSERWPLMLAEVLSEPGRPTRHVYFPITGFVSLVTLIDGHPGLEIGMVGREGMLGAQLALGVPATPVRALVQGPGEAWRIAAGAFRSALADSAALQRVLGRYLYVRMVQLASAAACLRFHMIEPRLARWLLMSHDRAGADSFHVTHEGLAAMLGVRRVGITVAAGSLQRGGLIAYHRGMVTVLNRPGLEATACACYAGDQRVHTAWLSMPAAAALAA